MKASTVISYAAALASSVTAVQFTNSAVQPTAGEPFTLTWTDATGPVNIYVVTGPNQNALEEVNTVGTGLTGGSTTFTLNAADFASGTYAFKIVDGSEDNFSSAFALVGTGSASSSSASTSPVSTTPAASSTEASSTTGSETTTTTGSETTTTTDAETTTTDASSTTLATSTTASGTVSSSGAARSSGSATRSSTSASTVPTDVPGAASTLSSSMALMVLSAVAMVFLN
ncbi:extracellular matrix protein [Ceratocystis lukuohia]|uniref:Extracellular matrix protein n=1 Tax=Ceratocystis lukuohia TaxID=2019550 RepID=A0ABR4MAU9_9PEZI